jgi:hypothetical protein
MSTNIFSYVSLTERRARVGTLKYPLHPEIFFHPEEIISPQSQDLFRRDALRR